MKIKQAKATPVRDGQAQKIEPKAKRPGGPGGQKFYVHDHLYSPVAVTNYLGQTAERYEYDAYGKCYILEPNFAPDPDGKSDVGNPYYFTGREMDQLNNYTLNIMNYRHRYYDTYTGRLTTHDPLGIVPNEDSELTKFEPRDQYRDNRSLYEAFGSNPVVNTDSWGLFTFPIGPPIGSHKTERLTKEAMYQFARTFLITKKHWQKVLDDWYYEKPPDGTRFFKEISDPRCKDIADNTGFKALLECWVAKKFGCNREIPEKGPHFEITESTFRWHFYFPDASVPGGWAAYTDATFFLGSYRAHLLAKRKTGEPCSLDIKVTVANTTDWVSASKTLKGLGWLIPDYPAHPRHEGPYHPSKGGTMEQRYIFKLESVPISKKCYLTD